METTKAKSADDLIKALLISQWSDKVSKEDFELLKLKLLNARFKESSNVVDISSSLTNLINPVFVLILSFGFGYFSFDRFYLGKWVSGVLKILLCFIVIGFLWVVVDYVLMFKAAKKKNFHTILSNLDTVIDSY